MSQGKGEQPSRDARLRQEADDLGIRGAAAMSAEELEKAIAERRRGADPQQSEAVARGRSHT